MKLDKRLQAVAAMVPAGEVIADIGTDHAYLPVHLIKKGHINKAIAGDIGQGPLLAAQRTIKEAELEDKILLRLGNGLEIVSPGEAKVLIIAGMGGSSIINIFSGNMDVVRSFDKLILQPMVGADEVRRYLVKSGWKIVEEDLVFSEDKDKIYQVIAFEQGSSLEFDHIFYDIGPLLWERRHPLLKNFISEQLDKFKYVAANMQKSSSATELPKYHNYLKKIAQLDILKKELELESKANGLEERPVCQ